MDRPLPILEIYGYDFTETDKAAAELKEALLKVNGVSEVNISRQDYQPEYQVDFDRGKIGFTWFESFYSSFVSA